MNAKARTSIDNLLATLKAELGQPGQSLIPLLTTMSRFTRYSFSNQLLIFAQRPTASHVLGYRSWLKASYHVGKGEQGIAIYAPMRFTHEDPGEDSNTLEPNSRTGFRVAYVFDIAQIDPLAGTDTAAFAAQLADNRDAHLENERLKAFLFGHNVELEYKLLAPGLMGYTYGRRITANDRTSRPARPKPKRSPICSALDSESPALTPRSSTSRPIAARPTRWRPRSSASVRRRSGSPPRKRRNRNRWNDLLIGRHDAQVTATALYGPAHAIVSEPPQTGTGYD